MSSHEQRTCSRCGTETQLSSREELLFKNPRIPGGPAAFTAYQFRDQFINTASTSGMLNQDRVTPTGSVDTASSDAIGDAQLEQLLCSRLAGDVLADALFVADAQMSDAIRVGLAPAARRAIEAAQAAISNAARSGLVLLTVSRPGLEPKADLEVTTRMRLAARMLQRINPNLPSIDVKESEHMPRARLPIGLPARLLVRALACHRKATHLSVHFSRAAGKNGREIIIRFEADHPTKDVDLHELRDLTEPLGGRVNLEGAAITVYLPTPFELEDEDGAAEDFLEGRAPKGPATGKD